jgi:ATP-dependent DNA helicase RecG
MNVSELLQKHEGKTVEFKRDVSSPESIIHTIIAFANTAGGTILIGVEDKTKTIRGITDPLAVEEKLVNVISDTISPRLIPSIEIISWRGKQLLAIEVFPSPSRPHFRTQVGEEKGVFVRIGSSNRKADSRTIMELHRARRHQSFDEEPLLEANSEALDFRVASELFADVRKLKAEDLLTLRLLTIYQGKKVPTNGGMILFGKERLKYFPDARIRCGRFAGTTKREIIDVLEVNTYPLYAVEQVLEFIRKHARESLEISDQARHRKKGNVPLPAVREAVINAVVHGDYFQTGVPIRVSFFDDRIEIDNPGMLYDGLTVEDITQGVSKLRNQVIGRVFMELGLVEQWGSGIPRMVETCREMGLPAPEFVELGGQFRVSISLMTQEPAVLDRTEQAIVKFLAQANGSSVKEIAAVIGISTRTVRARLAELVDKGVVTVVGTGPHDPKRKFFLA